MEIVKTYTAGDYTVNEYDNGTVERYLTGSDKPIEVDPEPTQEEINAEMLLNQMDIMAKQEEQDQVLAEILLNGLGV